MSAFDIIGLVFLFGGGILLLLFMLIFSNIKDPDGEYDNMLDKLIDPWRFL